MLETIVRYLVQGVSQIEIASIVGCSEGYISQVKDRKDYDLLCEEARRSITVSEKQKAREAAVDELEDMAYKSLKENMAYAEFSEVTKLIEILHRRKAGPNGVVINNNVINAQQNNNNSVKNVILQLPQAAVPEIRLNNQSEIIGIGNESLAPMSANNVKQLFIELSLKKEQRQREIDVERNREIEMRKQKEKIVDSSTANATVTQEDL